MAGREKYSILCAVILLLGMALEGQTPSVSIGPWSLRSVSGELGIQGLYQERNNTVFDVVDEQNSTYLIGAMRLNTDSYLWRPDIISISLNGEFNPETRNEKYLAIPNRSEVRTLQKLDLRTTIFSDKNISLSSWLNYNLSYFNRENLTNVRSDNNQWGTLLNFNNRALPFTIRYMSLSWDQTETESNRTFSMKQNSLQTKFSKSFFKTDKHDLTYSYDDYYYIYADQNAVANEVNRIALNNNLFFNDEKKSGYRSQLTYYDQKGKHSFNKIDASEFLYFRLPYNLHLQSTYNYSRLEDSYQLRNTNRLNTHIRHQLYESLNSEIFAEYSGTTHSIYHESEFKTGGELRYTKKIPFGRINLGYRYYRHQNTVESESGMVYIVNETHSLSDNAGIFLDKAYVESTSLILTDISGSIVYQEGLDYLVNEINNYLEIVRVPGGQIIQDQEVLASYSAIQPGTYHYEANNHSYNASLSMFSRLLEIYYRGGSQDMKNVEASEFLTLNEYDQNVVGAKFYYKFINGGMEYDHYNSTLIPYKRVNYFLNLHFKISSKIILSADGTLRDYKLLNTDVNHKYSNLSGRISYNITRQSKVNFQVAYLSQKGKNINLDLVSGRLDFMTNYRKMYFKTGLTIYNRSYTNSTFTYTRTFVELIRKF